MKKLLSIAICFTVTLFAQSYKIVGPENPKPYERTAMKELKEYLGKRIDGTLTIGGFSNITFVVGDSDLAKTNGLLSTKLPEENWVIKSFGDKVLLNGGGTRGALYATYHFLEDFCDIHWWSDIEEYVPEGQQPHAAKTGQVWAACIHLPRHIPHRQDEGQPQDGHPQPPEPRRRPAYSHQIWRRV